MDPAASHLRHAQRDGRHIDASRGADAIVVAPASADALAMLAHGRAGDLLSTLRLARECPLLVALAMNRQMWAHAATQRNAAQLRADGVAILGPDTARPHLPFCVGFAAESQDAEHLGEEKRRPRKRPLRTANGAQDAFGSDENEVTLLDDAGTRCMPRMGKLALARVVVGEIGRRLRHL